MALLGLFVGQIGGPAEEKACYWLVTLAGSTVEYGQLVLILRNKGNLEHAKVKK
jgi:hypothetical protein